MDRPLHVLQAVASPYPTRQGSQIYVRGMARSLVRRGLRVTVVCYGHGDGTEHLVDDLGVQVIRTPALPGYRNLRSGPDRVKPFLDLALAVRLLGLARHGDVVHAHNYEAPLAAFPARTLLRVPLIYSAHNTMEEELPVYFARPAARTAATWLGRVLDRQVPWRADAALALSEAGVAALRRLGCPRVHHLPPGVDLEELAGARPERARRDLALAGRPWVVYAGNPDPYQDLDVLVAAMGRLPEVGLLVVSAAPLEDLERACDRAGVGPRRRRLVVTPRWEDARDCIAAADLAGLPRTVCSGFPIKVLNYLGLGVPVVAARGAAPPIPGVVPVADRDPEALARVLGDLLADGGRRVALGEAARQAIAASWTWEARAATLEGIYREVLAARPPRR